MRKLTLLSVLSAAALVTASGFVVAAPSSDQHDCMGQDMKMSDMSAAQMDYMAAMKKMDKAMMSGMMNKDPGQSWKEQMIAHHQGAIDMSDVVLKQSKDAAILKVARETKAMNEKDLKKLRAQ